jgi:FHA domain-containing protein
VISLTVVSFNGAPPSQVLAARFDELGGSIGRGDSNQLVLPDPDRTISRVHAQVVFRLGAFAIIDRGSNAISVNDRPLGPGVEAALRPGDRVQIGGYILRVDAIGSGAAAGASTDPFAAFGGLAAGPAPPPQRSPAPSAAFAPASAPSARSAPSAPPAPFAAGPAGGIPDDWDPFASLAAPPPSPAAAPGTRGARDLGLDLGAAAPAGLIPDLPSASGAESSLDQLFGLGAPVGKDPLANSRLDAPLAQPNMAARDDPMQSLRHATPGIAAAAPDDVSELNRPFLPPPVAAAVSAPAVAVQAPAVTAAPSAASPPATPPPALPGAVLSWQDGAADGRTIIRPAARAPQAAPAAAPPAPTPAPAPLQAAAPVASASGDELWSALRDGLACPTLTLPPLTPDLMHLLGTLLHEATRGTLDLLAARAATKREIRAESTMIVARENNPLKFSPSVEVALGHLLGPAVRGFMPPQQAMRDAHDDLRAHQIAFLAGMRAALDGLLHRFDPAVLESRLTQKSTLASLLPGARKAELWSVFQQQFAQLSHEVEDNFHQVFGREFLRAYEAQLDALHNERQGDPAQADRR